KGLAVMANQFRQSRDRVGTNNLFMMISCKSACNRACVLELVEFVFFETDGKRLHRLGEVLAHKCDDSGRVDTTRKKRAERNVGYQMGTHRVSQHALETLAPLCKRNA